jgi:hypothetical protein
MVGVKVNYRGRLLGICGGCLSSLGALHGGHSMSKCTRKGLTTEQKSSYFPLQKLVGQHHM